MDWSWPKELYYCARADLQFFFLKTRRWGVSGRIFSPNPGKRGKATITDLVDMKILEWLCLCSVLILLSVWQISSAEAKDFTLLTYKGQESSFVPYCIVLLHPSCTGTGLRLKPSASAWNISSTVTATVLVAAENMSRYKVHVKLWICFCSHKSALCSNNSVWCGCGKRKHFWGGKIKITATTFVFLFCSNR